MIVGTVLVTAVLVLASQVMDPAGAGARPNITLGSVLGIPPDRVFTDWPVVAPLVQGFFNDVPFWFLLVLAAAVLYWLIDWIDEKLGALFGRARPPAAAKQMPPPAADGAPAPSGTPH